MKNAFLFALLLATSAHAQQSTLHGTVAVFNSQFETGTRRFVANAQVEEDFGRAQATITAADGSFRLALMGFKDQEKVKYSVKKAGYEVVNTDALQAVSGQEESSKVFMAREGKIAENKLKYYKINRNAAEKTLNEKLAKLEKQIRSSQPDQMRLKQLQEEQVQLQAQLENVESLARDLADRYATTNLDDVSKNYQRAFRCFQRGQLDSALLILKADHLESDAAFIIAEQNRNADLAAEYAKRNSVKNKQKNDVYEALHFKIGLLRTQSEFEKVAETFNLLMKMDSNDVRVLIDYAGFLYIIGQTNKAINYAQRALTFPLATSTIAMIKTNLAGYTEDPETRGRLLLEVLDMHRKECAGDGNSENCRIDLAIAEKNLAISFAQQNKFDKVESMLKGALEVFTRFSSHAGIKHHLQETEFNLAIYYTIQKNYPEAITHYNNTLSVLTLMEKKKPAEPQNITIAEVKSSLAAVYDAVGQYDKIVPLFREAIRLYQLGSKDAPNGFSLEIARQYENLVVFYKKTKDVKNAAQSYQEELAIYRKLAEKKPNPYEPEVARILFDWAMLELGEDNLGKAEACLEESLNIYDRWADFNYDAFGDKRSDAVNKLKRVYNKEFDKATTYVDKANVLEKTVVLYERIYQINKEALSQGFIASYADAAAALSTNQLYAKRFQKAEANARLSLKLNPQEEWPARGLAYALLFQGKFAEANPIFTSLKGRNNKRGVLYDSIILQEFKQLESEGITHPDVAKIRALFQNK